VVHKPTRFAEVVACESDGNQGSGPQACASAKPLIFQAKMEFSTVNDGHYQLPPGLKKDQVANMHNTNLSASMARRRPITAHLAGRPGQTSLSGLVKRFDTRVRDAARKIGGEPRVSPRPGPRLHVPERSLEA